LAIVCDYKYARYTYPLVGTGFILAWNTLVIILWFPQAHSNLRGKKCCNTRHESYSE
jgi:hypothetical protein